MSEEQDDKAAKLFAALSKFQGEVKPALKAKAGYGYKYADIAAVLEAARGPLAENGLCVNHTTETRFPPKVTLTRLDDSAGEDWRNVTEETEPVVILNTILGHVDGGSMVSAYPILPVKKDPQGYGSALTYARRYCFMAITGLPVADDDGASGSGKPTLDEGATAENGRNLYKDCQKFMAENAEVVNSYLRMIGWVGPDETWVKLDPDQKRQIADGLESFRAKALEHGTS